MRIETVKWITAAAVIAGCTAACGGGESQSTGPTQISSAEGLWNGSTASGRTATALVLDDGTYWIVYSAMGDSTAIGGVAQGNATSDGGTVTSSNGIDVNFEGLGVNDFTMSGSYVEKSSLTGTLTYPQASEGFSATYDPDYELTPSLSTIAGTYSGTTAVGDGVEAVSATITSGGQISGMGASGCSFTGMASLHAHGNVYDLEITFGGGVCSNGSATLTGNAYFIASSGELVGAAVNSGRTNGFIFVATHQ
jgi:hypothetical protein